MAYGSTSVVSTASVDEVDIVRYDDFLGVTLRAFRGDSVARQEMTEFIAMQQPYRELWKKGKTQTARASQLNKLR